MLIGSTLQSGSVAANQKKPGVAGGAGTTTAVENWDFRKVGKVRLPGILLDDEVIFGLHDLRLQHCDIIGKDLNLAFAIEYNRRGIYSAWK